MGWAVRTSISGPDPRVEWLEAVQRRERRLLLEIRTISLTLAQALRDLDAHEDLSDEGRSATRREWCERAREMLGRVASESRHLQRITSRLCPQGQNRQEELLLAEIGQSRERSRTALRAARRRLRDAERAA